MKLVTIIMPFYKKRSYIYRSIKSAINQTYRKIEIIIVYDDINISDLNYVKKISKLDRRIKLIVNTSNKGAGYSRNIAITKSKGYFIAFLDCDDLWKKDKLETQLKFMNKHKIKISHTSYSIINGNGRITGEQIAKKVLTYKELLRSCDMGLSSVILEKKILNKLRFPLLKTKEDYVLWLNITKNDIKIFGLNKKLSKWRKLPNSLSSAFLQKIFDGYRVYKNYMKFSLIKSFYYLIRLSLHALIKKI